MRYQRKDMQRRTIVVLVLALLAPVDASPGTEAGTYEGTIDVGSEKSVTILSEQFVPQPHFNFSQVEGIHFLHDCLQGFKDLVKICSKEH